MFKLPIFVDFNACTVSVKKRSLVSGDYNSTSLEFSFDADYSGTKTFEMKSPSGTLVMVSNIPSNNTIALVNSNGGTLFSEPGRYTFEVSLYSNNSKITSASGFIPVEKEQVVISGSVVEPYLPVFDELLDEVETALDEIDNINISAEKVGSKTSVVVTDRDGIEYEFDVLDGAKGDQGPVGPKGDKGDKGDTPSLSGSDYIDITNDTIELKMDDVENYLYETFDIESNVQENNSTHSNNEIVLWSGRSNHQIKSSGKKMEDLQEKLVSGTNIKTINNESILGSGNINIEGGSSEIFWCTYSTTGEGTQASEIEQALEQNKIPMVKIGQYTYVFCRDIGTDFIFNALYNVCSMNCLIKKETSKWSTSVSLLESTDNKATNFNTINDAKYPTTKAVVDYINSLDARETEY